MIKHFYIFRHGQTQLNAEGRFQGQSCNVQLNALGIKQAKQIAAQLRNIKPQVVVTSPLKRAFETAQIIANTLEIPLEINNRFIEGNFGVIEGKTKSELTAEETRIFADWVRIDAKYLDVSFARGETRRLIMNRAISALKVIAHSSSERIAIATHSTVLRMILLYLGYKQHDIEHGKIYHLILENGELRYVDDEKILLLSCCAPCSCAVIEKMAQDKRNFSVAFYNPNIAPLAEYQKRCAENKKVCMHYGVNFIELEYDNERWLTMTKSLENEPERGKRCSICFYMRLKRVMEFAKENGYTAVASVLGVSRWKDLNQVNKAADMAARDTNCTYLEIEGRKAGMQQRRAELINLLALYNQTYCGCKPEGE